MRTEASAVGAGLVEHGGHSEPLRDMDPHVLPDRAGSPCWAHFASNPRRRGGGKWLLIVCPTRSIEMLGTLSQRP